MVNYMSKQTILIVEDEQIIVEVIAQVLGDEFNIKVAKNGIDGFKAFSKIKPNIIISDINMPKQSGLDMAKEIRKLDRNVKIIFLTANSDLDSLLKATELKLTKYIMKPIVPEKLIEAVYLARQEILDYKIISQKIINLTNDFLWDVENKELKNKNDIIKLSPKEKEILSYFISNSNYVNHYDDIIINCWEYEEMATKDSLKNTMSTLRKKLPHGVIENIYATGYKIII